MPSFHLLRWPGAARRWSRRPRSALGKRRDPRRARPRRGPAYARFRVAHDTASSAAPAARAAHLRPCVLIPSRHLWWFGRLAGAAMIAGETRSRAHAEILWAHGLG